MKLLLKEALKGKHVKNIRWEKLVQKKVEKPKEQHPKNPLLFLIFGSVGEVFSETRMGTILVRAEVTFTQSRFDNDKMLASSLKDVLDRYDQATDLIGVFGETFPRYERTR